MLSIDPWWFVGGFVVGQFVGVFIWHGWRMRQERNRWRDRWAGRGWL